MRDSGAILQWLLFLLIGEVSVAIVTPAAQAAQPEVILSAFPENFHKYMLHDTTEGLVLDNAQCFTNLNQVKASSHKVPEINNSWTSRVRLDVTGSERVQHSVIPMDMVIAIDSSGSMADSTLS